MITSPPSNVAGGAAPIDCETAVRRLWDYLDGRLPRSASHEVEAHLTACEAYPPHFAFARSMQGALAASAGPPAENEAEARLRERVLLALRRQTVDDRTRDRGGAGGHGVS